jgi:hypothetical protein
MAASSAQSMWQLGSDELIKVAALLYPCRARSGIPLLSRVTIDELPDTTPTGSIDARGPAAAAATGVVGAAGTEPGAVIRYRRPANVCAETGGVSAMSGTTTAGLLLDASSVNMLLGAAEEESTMPPLIKATAGSDAQILRKGNVIVRTRRTLAMTLLLSNPSAQPL